MRTRFVFLLLALFPLFHFAQSPVFLHLDTLLNFYGKYTFDLTNRAQLSNGDRLMSFTPANNLPVTDGTPNDTNTYNPPFQPSEVHQLHVLYDSQFNIKARLWTVGGISVINDTIYALQRIEVVDSIDIDPNGSGMYVTPDSTPLIATRYNQDLELISYKILDKLAWRQYWKWEAQLGVFILSYQKGYPTAHVYIKQLDKNFTLLDSHYVGFSTALNNYPPYLKSFFPAVGGGYYGVYGVNGVGGNYNFDLSGNSTTGTPVSYQRLVLVKYNALLSPVWITQIADQYSSFFLVYGPAFYQDAQGRLLGSVYNPDEVHYFTYAGGMDSISIPISQGKYLLYEIDDATGHLAGPAARSQNFQTKGTITTTTTTAGLSRAVRTIYTQPSDTIYFDPFQKTSPIPNQELGLVVYSDIYAGTVDTWFSLPTVSGKDSVLILAARQRPDGRLELTLSSIASSVQPDPNYPQNILNYPGLAVRAYTVWTAPQLVHSPETTLDRFTLMVYPNPTSDRLTIDTDAHLTAIHLTDLQGRELLTADGQVRELALGSLPAGVYLLRMEMKSGVQAVKRVVLR